ncbi:cytochrome b5-related protein [Bradysia coprophila]|uniref:cytochrome b5-related protein n=1 Tax=Bradysia coprophila TaxID=38358 RepID=UPI00187DB896|nr:cytochrome b5-related protein [Bradysia coprophila]XP_037042217.1 cytochrome b5-related protein [Bradysia coprophila]XP_037042218.1 cytochrome b5-related protein [Bradysia coprophila]XP_037042219.1 cytochrome b5-related protein [Bradysia coprophila]
MSPKKRFSTIANYYPSFQDINPLALSPERWLKSRWVDDKAEGLWRLNDTLYDFTDFIKLHPGGSDWIRLTKGTDITEAFEIHHIYPKGPESLLEKYQVRKAAEPRNFKFTFKDDGFYRTFKRKVGEKLKTVDRSPEQTSKYYIDSILLATFLTAVLSLRLNSTLLTILSGLCLNYTTICAHNFFHQKDNFRMYYFNLSFLNYRQWRIQHSMSHHLYANSIHDLEVSIFEPFLCWTPMSNKNVIQRYASWIYAPIIYGFIFLNHYVKSIIFCVVEKKNLYHTDDLIPFTLPFAMYLFGVGDLTAVFKTWISIVLFGSIFFGFIGLNAGHHNVYNVHDGDTLSKDMDWGIYCLDTVIDNSDISHSHLASLTHFGNHLMHHLVPTIDHGVGLQLYSVLFETMAEFETKFEEYPWFVHISGQLRQLAKNAPSIAEPEERKKMRIKENSQ